MVPNPGKGGGAIAWSARKWEAIRCHLPRRGRTAMARHRMADRAQLETDEVEKMSDNIGERVKKIVVEHLGVEPDKVTENASFIDDLGADSLDTVELVMAFEEEFG